VHGADDGDGAAASESVPKVVVVMKVAVFWSRRHGSER